METIQETHEFIECRLPGCCLLVQAHCETCGHVAAWPTHPEPTFVEVPH